MFSERLKYLRLALNMTQKEMAEKLSYSQTIFSYYESGEREPNYQFFKNVKKVFGDKIVAYLMGLDSLIENTNPMILIQDNIKQDK